MGSMLLGAGLFGGGMNTMLGGGGFMFAAARAGPGAPEVVVVGGEVAVVGGVTAVMGAGLGLRGAVSGGENIAYLMSTGKRTPTTPGDKASKGVATARAVAGELPAGVKCLHKCMDFSEGLEAGLKAKGVQGTRIDIETGVFVYSDEFGALGAQGSPHRAVQVGDTIFDNMRPGGVPAQQFWDDLGGDMVLDSPAFRVTRTDF